MPPIRIIRLPIELGEDGLSPEDVKNVCEEYRNYILHYRLPQELQGLTLWVEPTLRLEEGELRLVLVLDHDGQIPLNFEGKSGETPSAAITRELDTLAKNIERALNESNDIWALAAEIANNEADPAAEVEHLRWVSGYQAPVKPRTPVIPSALQVITRQGTLVLEAPEIAPEYVETHELKISARVVARENALCAVVSQCEVAEDDVAFVSRVAPKQDLRIRWPEGDVYPWKVLAGLASLLEIPIDLQGRGVISMCTLHGKAFEVSNFNNAQEIVDKLIETIAPIINFQPES
jgi:hypothetical protein